MDKGTQEKQVKLTPEKLKSHTEKAVELVSQLTVKQRFKLSMTIPLLPNFDAPLAYRTIYQALTRPENKKTSLEDRIMPNLFRSELKNQLSQPRLVDDIVAELAKHLDTSSLGKFLRTNKSYYAAKSKLFKPENWEAMVLFESVLDADLKGRASRLINTINPEKNGAIVLKRVSGEELCGQRWKASALEFSVLVGDIHLMRLLLGKVPDDMKSEALEQLEGVKKNGLNQIKHLAPLRDLIAEGKFYISTYISNRSANKITYAMGAKYCVNNIGGKQQYSSVFGLQWFSNDSYSSNYLYRCSPPRDVVIDGRPIQNFLPDLGKTWYLSIDYPMSKIHYNTLESKPTCTLSMFENSDRAYLLSDRCKKLEELCEIAEKMLDVAISELKNEIAGTKTEISALWYEKNGTGRRPEDIWYKRYT